MHRFKAERNAFHNVTGKTGKQKRQFSSQQGLPYDLGLGITVLCTRVTASLVEDQ
jgi:hypothetical protein